MIGDTRRNYPMLNFLDAYLKGIDGFIAGGCFRSIFDGNPPRDIDMFFRSKADFSRARDIYAGNGWETIYENENATGFRKKGMIDVDLVRSVYGTPEEILSNFDFTVTKFIMDDQKVVFAKTYWRDLHFKALSCDDRIPFPVGTFERAWRYAKYGYFMGRKTKIALIEAIQSLGSVCEYSCASDFYHGSPYQIGGKR